MTIGKIFFEEPISDKKIVEIKGENFRYLSGILRVKKGEQIFLIDNHSYYLSEVDEIFKDFLTVRVIEKRVISPLDFKISLYFGLLKGDKNDFIFRFGTQLATYAFHPLIMKRTVVRIKAEDRIKKTERYRRIVRECARDAFLGFVPEVYPVEEISKKKFHEQELKILFYEGEKLTGLTDIKAKIEQAKSLSAFFGPEGGIEKEELDFLIGNGFIPVSLGERMVKAETAIMAGLSMLSFIKKGRLL